MAIPKKEFYKIVNESKKNRFITFIQTDSPESVKENMDSYQAEYPFGFHDISCESVSWCNDISFEEKVLKKSILFITEYVFNTENDGILRSLYDTYPAKIIVLPKYHFNYSSFSTELSGRVEIVKYYHFQFASWNTEESFKDHILQAKDSSDLKKDFLMDYGDRHLSFQIDSLLTVFASSIGTPLSIRDIREKINGLHEFMHPRTASMVIQKLIDNRIIVPCHKFDEYRNVIVGTNLYYFFNSIPMLKEQRKNTDSFDTVMLNAFYLELYYRFSDVFYLKEEIQGVYTFLAVKTNGEKQYISFIYKDQNLLLPVIESLRKKQLDAKRIIVTGNRVRPEEAFGIRIRFIDDYLKEE